jgi:DNA sulfur modification protein DndD
MKLRILGWETKDMRCPDAKLKFNEDDKIDFLQMNNGTGKTTSLILIKMALSGEKDIIKLGEEIEAQDKQRNDLPDNLHSLIRSNKNKGKFVLYTKINDEPYTFEIEINRQIETEQAAKISTISKAIGGKNIGWMPPEESKPFLSIHFVNLFVFNGENASALFVKGSDYAKQSIYTLCQFNILEEARSYADEYLKLRTLEAGRSGEKGVKTRFQNLLNEAEGHLKKIEKERNKLNTELQDFKKKFKELDEKIGKKIKENKENEEKRTKIDEEIKDNKKRITDARKNIYYDLINPARINKSSLDNLISFKNDLSALKLPDNAARSFFIELSKNKKCVCNTPIGPKEKKAIIENAESYLDDSSVSILNAFKTSISRYEDSDSFELMAHFETLNKADKKEAELETAKTRFLASVGKDDENFTKNVKEHEKLRNEIRLSENVLNEYDGPSDQDEVKKGTIHDDLINIETIKKIVEKYKNANIEVNKTVQLKEATDLFKEILSGVIVKSKQTITQGIKEKAQTDIDKILTEANPKIVIKEIDNYVELTRVGAESEHKGTGAPLSMGQRLAAAYIFMSSALSYSNASVPFIVDSPTGSLDDVNREGIGKAIPNVADQFITFIQPSEKKIFYSHARESANYKCSHTTIFWLTPKVKEWLKANDKNIKEEDKEIYDDWGVVYGHTNMKNYELADEADESNEFKEE